MSDWHTLKLEDCADILDHLRIPINEEERKKRPGQTPYYGANGIQGTIDGWIFNEPLILMAEDGGYFDEFETRPIAYKIIGKSWVNNHAHVIRPNETTDFNYLFYSLEHKNILPYIKGGTRAKLNQKELRAIEIYLPFEKQAQTAISKILDGIDQTIEKTEALIHKYQQIKAGLMHDLFTRGVTADGKLRPPREQAPELYKETSIGWIPKAWRVMPLNQLATYQHGRPFPSTDYSNEGVLLLRPGNLHINGFVSFDEAHTTRIPEKWLIKCPAYALQHGDILMNLTAQSLEDQFLGRVCLNTEKEPVLLNQRIAKFKGIAIDHYFLYWLLKSHQFREQIDHTTQGTKVQHLYNSDLNRVLLGVPKDKEEQLRIADRLKICVEAIQKNIEIFHKLKKQKSGLMEDLLTGKVQVKTNQEEPCHV
ncbi:MAG: restriction endonuclease subunit S [Desulfobacterium sp.]|jgi:type I restriction enzyme S subunit|nr:restriction endonuclease subunit S [Desulfobacterium sp.]